MKIDGPGSVRPGQTKKVQRGGGNADFRTHLNDGDGDGDGAGKVSGTASAFAVNPLFALQEVDDALTGRRKARQRAEDILDVLEELRIGLLTGTFPQSKLQDLVRLVQARRESVDDPRLQAVLDEIDLRAQVELAKLGR